jgi:prophage regulatory protein
MGRRSEISLGTLIMQFTIPEIGFVRLHVVLMVIPVGKTCWWEGVKSGRFPKPVKLSKRITAWRAEDIRTGVQL